MELKVAEYSDYQRIAQLQANRWQEDYQGILDATYLKQEVLTDRTLIWQTRLLNPSYNQHVLLLEEQGTLCGFVCVFGNHDVDNGSMIDALHIAPDYRGRGLGRQLLLQATEWLDKYFADGGVYVEVIETNHIDTVFYEQMQGQSRLRRLWRAPDDQSLPARVWSWASPRALRNGILQSQPVLSCTA